MSTKASGGFARLLAAVGGIYIAQSLISGLALQATPALLRAQGVSLQWVGLSSLFMLPWALRFLWAPAVERCRLPAHQTRSRARPMILAGQLVLAGVLLVVAIAGAQLPRAAVPGVLVSALLLAALVAASVDIVCDGYTIDRLCASQRGWGNVAQVGGSYVGFLLGGSAYLVLADRLGWTQAMGLMALAIVLTTLPMLAAGEPSRMDSQTRQRPSLRNAWQRPAMRRGLLLSLTTGLGIRLSCGLIGPLLIDRGASIFMIGSLFGPISVLAGLGGTLLGGALVRWRGAAVALHQVLRAQMVLLLLLAVGGAGGAPVSWLIAGGALLLGSMASGFVAAYSLLMGLTSQQQAGLDFTLFQCAEAVLAAVAGVAGGLLAQYGGYPICFALSALAALTASVVLTRLQLGDGDRQDNTHTSLMPAAPQG
jgi:MFS transporter, putative signal transducer